MVFQWYQTIDSDSELEQGDIIERCNVILPRKEHYEAILDGSVDTIPADVIEITAIVLSQSCDIQNNKIDSLIVCPIWPLGELIKSDPYYQASKAREELRQGKAPSFHLLNKVAIDGRVEDYYFVDFHNIYSIPKVFVIAIAKERNRSRLLPPYKEHLSQSFARYFMRVGLPTDISRQEIRNYSA